MKKYVFLLLFNSFLAFTAQAQIAELQYIDKYHDNFTLTDINNVVHDMYSYTDAGYTVILDMGATWCSPCWTMHGYHIWDSLNAHYGPNGTITPGKIKVFWVELDQTTTMADLNGTGSNTLGDWVTGVNYPIVNISQAELTAMDLDVSSFPTMYVMCPNRVISAYVKGGWPINGTEPFWLNYVDDCPKATLTNNAGLIEVGTEDATCAKNAEDLVVRLQNIGTAPLTNASIKASIGASTIATYIWNGNLSTYNYADVTIGNHAFQSNATVDYEITTASDPDTSDNHITKAIISSVEPSTKAFTLEVKMDDYPGDIRWWLKNELGTYMQFGTYTAGPGFGGAGGPDAKQVFTYTFDNILSNNQCYEVIVEDNDGSLKDGVSLVDSGYIRIYSGATVSQANLLHDFGAEFNLESKMVYIGYPTGTDNIVPVENIDIYPNPSTGIFELNIDLSNASKTQISISDLNGQVLVDRDLGKVLNLKERIDLSTYSNGIYILSVQTPHGKTVRKINLYR